jgi:hypothetical protein
MLPAGVVGLFGVADIAALGISLDAVMAHPGRPWEQSVPLSLFTRMRNSVRRFFGFARSAPAISVRADLAIPDRAPLDRRPIVGRGWVSRDPPATPRLMDERRSLLEETKQRLSDDQGKRMNRQSRCRALQGRGGAQTSPAGSEDGSEDGSELKILPAASRPRSDIELGQGTAPSVQSVLAPATPEVLRGPEGPDLRHLRQLGGL